MILVRHRRGFNLEPFILRTTAVGRTFTPSQTVGGLFGSLCPDHAGSFRGQPHLLIKQPIRAAGCPLTNALRWAMSAMRAPQRMCAMLWSHEPLFSLIRNLSLDKRSFCVHYIPPYKWTRLLSAHSFAIPYAFHDGSETYPIRQAK